MDLVQAKASGKKWLLRIAVGGVLLFLVGSALFTLVTLNFSYSTGERVGFVQKISRRGWICKTHEGDLAMVNIAGQPAQMFAFTVRDDAVAKEIESFSGHQVELHYEEHRGVPTSCFGDTSYFVTSAKRTDK